MPMEAALQADIAYAVESRAFLNADERQVRKFDADGNANELSNIELHKEFERAADQSFMPAPTVSLPGIDL
ncbi:MAG: hypothetical protein CMH27_10965 [Micavibrio sp.]|nr:hypothetical protein [Micavibrio sp.]